MRWAIFAPLALAACGNAAKIETARPGQTIKLSGDQGVITLRNKTWSPAITVDAGNATFTGIVLNNVTGIRFSGGTVIGPGGKSYGVHVNQSRNVTIDNMTITGAHRGVVINQSQDVNLRDNRLTALISDGVDIAASQRVRIEGNTCTKFTPTLATFGPDGTKHDGDHPDCIQAWSVPGRPPLADIKVIGNHADGVMQGIFFGNPEKGGSDRIEIRDNVLRTGLGNSIFVANGRDAVVRNNTVSALPGARQLRNGQQVKAKIIFGMGSTGQACDNAVADMPGGEPTRPCRN